MLCRKLVHTIAEVPKCSAHMLAYQLGVCATPSLLPRTAARQPGSQTIHTLPVGSLVLPFLKPQGGHHPHFKHDLGLSQDETNEKLEDGNIPERGEGRKAAWRRHPNRAWENGNSVLGKGHKAEGKV